MRTLHNLQEYTGLRDRCGCKYEETHKVSIHSPAVPHGEDTWAVRWDARGPSVVLMMVEGNPRPPPGGRVMFS